jgi:FtsZ-binding cell division protein ZapB
LLQTVVRLRVECNSVRQERDNARGRVNDLLGEVEIERGLKLKAEDVSARLTMEVARDKAKIHTLETEVSQQRGEIDKLWSDITGESSGPVSFLFPTLRCLFDMVGVKAWASLEDKLTEEVVKSRDPGTSL